MLFIHLDYPFQTIDQLIETGDSEQIFQKAIQEQGRGQVSSSLKSSSAHISISFYFWLLSIVISSF